MSFWPECQALPEFGLDDYSQHPWSLEKYFTGGHCMNADHDCII
jgi:hypothetical protein